MFLNCQPLPPSADLERVYIISTQDTKSFFKLTVAQVLLLLNYFTSFYVIFHHISQNLSVLREQLSYIEDEDVHAMHDAVYTKYMMSK
jgi:hypothetical protein